MNKSQCAKKKKEKKKLQEEGLVYTRRKDRMEADTTAP